MEKPVLLVMAAGMGSRYGGQKQIDPIGSNGELIIDYSIYDAKRAGFETVVFVIKQENEAAFKEAIGDRLAKVMTVKYAYQKLEDIPMGFEIPKDRVKPWGTAHAVYSAREAIRGSFAVINADDYYGAQAFREIYDYLCQNQDNEIYEYAMVGYHLENTVTEHGHVARGLCNVSGNGYLTEVTEHVRIEKRDDRIVSVLENEEISLAPDTKVSMNMWGLTNSYFNETEKLLKEFLTKLSNGEKAEFYLPYVISTLIESGKARVKVITTPDKWYGMTYKEDKQAVQAAIAKKVSDGGYKANLWA